MKNLIPMSGPYLVRTHRQSPLGVLAFLLLLSVIVLLLLVPLDDAGRYLVSSNYYLEWFATFALIAAPPAAVALAFLHWIVTGRVFLSLVTIAMGTLLTLCTVVAIVMGYLH